MNACDDMLELGNAFKGIDVVMTTMQEWSNDSRVSAKERDKIILNLSRCLCNLSDLLHWNSEHKFGSADYERADVPSAVNGE